MFGLGQKKGEEGFVFELEKELQGIDRYAEVVQRVEDRVKTIKEMLRQGLEKSKYQELGQLLQGYVSLLKVLSRVVKK